MPEDRSPLCPDRAGCVGAGAGFRAGDAGTEGTTQPRYYVLEIVYPPEAWRVDGEPTQTSTR